MNFEWDENKNISNQQKHKVSFELATRIFDDCHQYTLEIQQVNHEERFLTIGYVHGIFLVVVHTYYEDNSGYERVRIISARKANKLESTHYVENYRRTTG